MENINLNLYVKENNSYVSIPNDIFAKGNNIVSDYIKIYSEIEILKQDINNYLFNKNSGIEPINIMDKILKIKQLNSIDKVLPSLDIDLDSMENRLINICSALGVSVDRLTEIRDELAQSSIRKEHCIENIISENYVNEIINYIKSDDMYSLSQRSKYGTMSSEYNLKNFDDIDDLNEEEVNGRYSPILVIHKPAKYHRGSYILDDITYIYIKRQPLNALISQEKFREKGIDGMGAILYKKLDNNLTNENLQELLAEIYVYAQQNNINFENIKLSDIGDNKVWMTADKLKKEFKELRYYNKNLSQKLREIYDTTSSYYTQIGGKYIFSSRTFLANYKAFKDRDING